MTGMHPTYRLETPAEQSQFRRPWSPDPYDPFPSASNNRNNDEHDFDPYQRYDLVRAEDAHISSHKRRQNREPSDVSVEALDLADYARTLHARQSDNWRPIVDPQDLYSRFPRNPPRPTISGDSLHQVPSLVSRVNTLSTDTHSLASSHQPIHRPYSMPDTAHIHSQGSFTRISGVGSANACESEIDISQFPAWSRGWYRSPGKKNRIGVGPPDYDLDTPPPQRISIFDPSFKPKQGDEPYSLPSYNKDLFPTRSSQRTSTRDYLPWISDFLDADGDPVNAETKQERIRMLEREFGPKSKNTMADDAFLDENGRPLVGTVDKKGRLVTPGPRKRAALRVLQILLSFVAAVPSIYAALVIKPKEGAPPPAGKVAAFVLYVVSVITALFMLYLFLFRPCCVPRKRNSDNPLTSGLMVLPVQALPGGKGGKKKKRKGKKDNQNAGGDVQVNLIVDPYALGGQGKGGEGNGDDEEWGLDYDGSVVGKKRHGPRRRSVFAGLAMEEEWKRARAWAKKMAAIDVVGLVLWGATFAFILLGKRCPSGGYEGWCNAYNVSSAAACLLCVGFGVSVFFDVKDLYASKLNPRTRT
ncbi:hypothetical protein AX17_003893 [Amanita inopinata Kibby_2008]|nr:hypothetical protein AX17_003893 [Amanita inopinata Kibby_2008]